MCYQSLKLWLNFEKIYIFYIVQIQEATGGILFVDEAYRQFDANYRLWVGGIRRNNVIHGNRWCCKVIFLKPSIPHFRALAKSRPTRPEIYTSRRSCWLTVFVMPTHVFGEAILQTSKIHNLFIQYSNNAYFNALESPWKWGENS
jgi:hypothetical protein